MIKGFFCWSTKCKENVFFMAHNNSNCTSNIITKIHQCNKKRMFSVCEPKDYNYFTKQLVKDILISLTKILYLQNENCDILYLTS